MAVIGFNNSDGDGLYGIEAYYNEYLSGIDGKTVTAQDANGNEMYSEVKELKNYCMQIGSFSLVNLRSAVGKNTGKMTFVVSVKTPSTKDAFYEVTRFDFTK